MLVVPAHFTSNEAKKQPTLTISFTTCRMRAKLLSGLIQVEGAPLLHAQNPVWRIPGLGGKWSSAQHPSIEHLLCRRLWRLIDWNIPVGNE